MEADAVQTSPWAAQVINIDGNQIEVLVGRAWFETSEIVVGKVVKPILNHRH